MRLFQLLSVMEVVLINLVVMDRCCHHKYNPVFRRSARIIPAFPFPFSIPTFPVPEFFPYFQHSFDTLWGLFLLQNFFIYVIIIALYSTLCLEVFYVLLLKKRQEKKRDLFTNV